MPYNINLLKPGNDIFKDEFVWKSLDGKKKSLFSFKSITHYSTLSGVILIISISMLYLIFHLYREYCNITLLSF